MYAIARSFKDNKPIAMVQEKKRLTILVVPTNAVGHVNACVGTTKPLLDRGHQLIFMTEQAFKGEVATLGFEEHIYKLAVENFSQEGPDVTPGEDWAQALVEKSILGLESMESKWAKLVNFLIESSESHNLIRQMDLHIKDAIEATKPDLIIMDITYLQPAVAYSGIPWIHNMSITPQVYSIDEDIPPSCSGLPSNAPRDELWFKFRRLHEQFYYNSTFNDLIESLGYPRYVNDRVMPNEEALLVVYAIAEDLNFPALRSIDNWFNLEVFNKNKLQEVVNLRELVGEEFYLNTLGGKWSGKWVYFSMGTNGSIDLVMMKRLLSALAETNHKVIVSKGPRHTEFELPANAWGDRYLPQTKLVSLMDLVITHGGNNTTTETFAQGKPMIILPLYGDQFDNAQRMHENGFGIRLNPYDFTNQELVCAVDRLLDDQELKDKMNVISKRIINSNRHEQLVDLIESKMLDKCDLLLL